MLAEEDKAYEEDRIYEAVFNGTISLGDALKQFPMMAEHNRKSLLQRVLDQHGFNLSQELREDLDNAYVRPIVIAAMLRVLGVPGYGGDLA